MRLKNVEDVYSLAPMQKGILFHIRYAPQSEIYFSQFICTIEQPLDVDAFRQAWQQMLTRHAVLRTAFLWEGLDEPLQLVNRQVELPWEHLDWRGLPAAEQEARLAAFLTADRARGFDLAVAPLLRLFLIQTTEQTYTFISSSSHLLMDGWSRVLLLQEVSACYKALVRGQSPRLPRVRPYRDYIGWLQRQDLSCAEDYWRKILQGFTVPTTLGRAHQSTSAREEEQQPLYTSRELSLSGELTAALQDFVRQQQLTLNTLLQGAWAIVLSRYSGEQDIVFGATVAGRPTSLPGSESIVGLFINTLPLRVAVQPAASLIPWLKYLQEQQATMLEYQHVPLVDIQQWSDIPHGQQLFESIFVFENTLSAVAWEQTEELQFRGIRGGVEQTNYPLTLVIGPDSELLLRLSYDTHLFAPEMIDQLLNHLRNLLAHMIASPSACLRDLLILSTDEQRRLLVEWNQTQRPYPANRNVQELFEAQVIRAPDAVALVFEDQSLTYHELNTRANQLAWYLQSKGVALETRIAICMERCLALIVGLLGILKAGGAYVPLDPDYPAERLAFMLQNAHISLLLTQQHLLALFPESDADIICLDSVITQLQQYNPANLLRGAKAQNLAYVMYTSGSTGRPKGVEITHQNIVRLLCGVDYAQLDNAQTFLQMAPVAFDAATFEIWGGHGPGVLDRRPRRQDCIRGFPYRAAERLLKEAAMRRRLPFVLLAIAVLIPFAPAGPASAAVDLKFYYPVSVAGPLAKVMEGMVADFNRLQPGTRVTPVFAGGYFETMAKTQTSVQGGSPPDVAVLLSTDLFTLLDMNAIIPLNPFIEQAGGERFRQDFFDAFWLNSRIGGTVYSIPFQRSTIVLYYNKDAFQSAGLDPAKPPKNWTELEQYAQKLTSRDASGNVTRWGVGIPTTGFTYWLFQGFVAEAGGKLANPEGTEVYYNTPQTKRALGYWLKLQDMKVEPPNVTDWGTLPTEFVAGKFAMIYHSTGSLTFVHSNAKFPFGTAFMPADKQYGTPTGGGNLYIFKNIPPERQKAAWVFVQWMTAPQQAARWSEASGYVAVRKSAFNIKLFQEYIAKFPQAMTAKDQLQYAQAELSTHNGGEIQKVLSDHLQAALTRTRTPDQTLQAAQQQADQILSQFKKK